jgi:hypothetical protein
MKSKRISVDVGFYYRDPEREEVWEQAPASRRNTADMLKEYSAGVLIKGYRAYLRGDYVDSRRFADFMERGRKQKVRICEEAIAKNHPPAINRLRRMEGRHEWILTIRENISFFLLNITGLSGNCRLRRAPKGQAARGGRCLVQNASVQQSRELVNV